MGFWQKTISILFTGESQQQAQCKVRAHGYKNCPAGTGRDWSWQGGVHRLWRQLQAFWHLKVQLGVPHSLLWTLCHLPSFLFDISFTVYLPPPLPLPLKGNWVMPTFALCYNCTNFAYVYTFNLEVPHTGLNIPNYAPGFIAERIGFLAILGKSSTHKPLERKLYILPFLPHLTQSFCTLYQMFPHFLKSFPRDSFSSQSCAFLLFFCRFFIYFNVD